MSYVRWGPDSNVYIIGTVRGDEDVIECVGCSLAFIPTEREIPPEEELAKLSPIRRFLTVFPVLEPNGQPYYFRTEEEMLDHIAHHREVGHLVPQYVDERLRRQINERSTS